MIEAKLVECFHINNEIVLSKDWNKTLHLYNVLTSFVWYCAFLLVSGYFVDWLDCMAISCLSCLQWNSFVNFYIYFLKFSFWPPLPVGKRFLVSNQILMLSATEGHFRMKTCWFGWLLPCNCVLMELHSTTAFHFVMLILSILLHNISV